MKRIKNTLIRLSSFLLVAIMLAGIIPAFTQTVSANSGSRPRKKYEIAIVYDNSSSMFGDTWGYEKYWCRAKYAMEIFASMLDYSAGDRLSIFPMWAVTTDGSTDVANASLGPIKINSEGDIGKITNMYTTQYGSTPFVPAVEAKNYLNSLPNDREKWIIIMTDGEFNTDDDRVTRFFNALSKDQLMDRMLEIASDTITVQYIGFGGATRLDSVPSKHFYGQISSDTGLKDDLIGICNKIFERDELPKDGRLNGTSLKLDLSMKKLIVFVQGAGAKIDSLTDSNGKSIGIISSPGQRKYSTVTGIEPLKSKAQVDNTLAGQVVTFGACSKGNYTLNYSGAEAVQIFYEPDVELQVSLESVEDGTVFTEASEAMTAGEYIVRSAIVDSQTGEDVTNHPLMGKSSLKTTVDSEKNGSKSTDGREVKVNFDPDDPVSIVVDGEYLNGYRLTTKGDNRFDWLLDLAVKAPAVDLKVTAEVTQENSIYKLKSYESWKPIRVTMTIDGLQPTEEQLARTVLTLKSENGVAARYERVAGEPAFNVYVGYNEDGEYVQPAVGEHEIEIMVTYTDEFGENTSKKKDVEFEVQTFTFAMSAEVQQDGEWYILKEHEDWKPIRVDVSIDDQPMTAEQLMNVKLTLKGEKDVAYYYEPVEGESAFNIYIGYKDANTYVEPEKDDYEFKVKAVYSDVSGVTVEKNAEVEFEISSMSKLMIILIWIIVILILFLIWLMFMLQKVLPKEMVKDKRTFWCVSAGELGQNVVDFNYSRKGKSITIKGPNSIPFSEQCSATFTVKAVDNRFTPKKSRRCEIINIQSSCSKVRLGGAEFVKVGNQWVKKTQVKAAASGKPVPPISHVLSPNPDFRLIAEPNGYEEGRLTCKAKTKK